MDNDRTASDRLDEEGRVARFLTDNPDWLATRMDIYSLMSPPRRVHGEILADHMAAMIGAARRQAADMTAHAESVLQAGRAAIGLVDRVRAAVLALIGTQDIGEWVTSDLPGLLGIDSALLCIEQVGGAHGSLLQLLMARNVPVGTVSRLLGTRDVLVRTTPRDAIELHGEAAGLAAQDALLRVPVPGLPPMLLALASRDAAVLEEGLNANVATSMTGGTAGGGRAALAFLGEALAARIETLAGGDRR